MMKKIELYEVGFRDWRFCHKATIETESIVETIKMLVDGGMRRVEIGASVNYDRYPEVKDSFKILEELRKLNLNCRYVMYVGSGEKNYPKNKVEELVRQGKLEKVIMPDEISVSISASEKRNFEVYGISGNRIFEHIKKHIERAKSDGLKVRGYVSAAFGYENKDDVMIQEVIKWCKLLFDLGCYEVSLGDTRGKAFYEPFTEKWKIMRNHLPLDKIALHFHEHDYFLWERDLTQVLKDVSVFDTSILDIPMAKVGKEHDVAPIIKSIPPNASTEQMIFFINQMNAAAMFNEKDRVILGADSITTGLDYAIIKEAGDFIRRQKKIVFEK